MSRTSPPPESPTVATAASAPATTTGIGRQGQPRGADGRFVPTDVPERGDRDALPEDRYLDRELSWLQFNERVLQLAADPAVPLLERCRYLAIFASNLDEFFMVRVAGIRRRIGAGIATRSASGLEPREVLGEIYRRGRELMERHAAIFEEMVRPRLEEEEITIVSWADLTEPEHAELSRMFSETVFPVLTPLVVDPAHPFPYISGLSLNLGVVLTHPTTGRQHFARLKVPPRLPRLIPLTDPDEMYAARFLPLEELIGANLDQLFPGMTIEDHFTFRVTRNEDLEVEEDDAENLLTAIERELSKRRFGKPVRLEVEADMSDELVSMLIRELAVLRSDVFRLSTLLDLRALNQVADLGRTELRYPAFVPHTHPDLAPVESSEASDIFAAMRRKDVLLHHPYDSFSTSVVAMLEQAAADPHVLAIKQTLYRTSGDSPIVEALIEAAEEGKQVLAVVELKARFDEENNIVWARKLERAGVHVVYGLVGLKTHAKLCLIVRQESDGLRRYCHIGTGNYNPRTARLYEDVGVLTTDREVGEEMGRLFNQLSGMAPKSRYSRFLVAPRTVRTGLIERIEAEAARGSKGLIQMKVNSIVDEAVTDALYRASQAGTRVDIWVRGICAVRPGVPGLSENISVRSVLGRFLEHSRFFIFGNGGKPELWIGSADLMHRNLDRRVESLVRLDDPDHIKHLTKVMGMVMSDSVSSWHLDADGVWNRHNLDADGEPKPDIQSELIAHFSSRRSRGRKR